MVIGDEENDLSMFCCAKIKVAMKNANLQIKKELILSQNRIIIVELQEQLKNLYLNKEK